MGDQSDLRPWERGESLLAAISRWDRDRDGDLELPDEAPPDPEDLPWIAGAGAALADRVGLSGENSGGVGWRPSTRHPRAVAVDVVRRLGDLARNPGDRQRLALYRIAVGERTPCPTSTRTSSASPGTQRCGRPSGPTRDG